MMPMGWADGTVRVVPGPGHRPSGSGPALVGLSSGCFYTDWHQPEDRLANLPDLERIRPWKLLGVILKKKALIITKGNNHKALNEKKHRELNAAPGTY